MAELCRPSAPHPLRRTCPPPEAFFHRLECLLAERHFHVLGRRVEFCVDNTVAMESSFSSETSLGHFGGDQASVRIVVDWAQIERLVLFSSFVRAHVGTPLAASYIVAYLEREIFLIAARSAAVLGLMVRAREFHRLYHRFQSPFQLDRAAEEGWPARAGWHALYIIYHELGHQLCETDSAAVRSHFERFEETYPRLTAFHPPHADELFCDNHALDNLWGPAAASPDADLISETVLTGLYMELYSVVKNLVLRHEAAHPLDKETGDHQLLDRIQRSHQVHIRLETMAETCRDPDLAAHCRAWAELQEALLQAIEEALINGVTRLSPAFWGDPARVRSCLREMAGGAAPAGRQAIMRELGTCDESRLFEQ